MASRLASPETDMALERLKNIDIRKLEGGTKTNICAHIELIRTRNRFLLMMTTSQPMMTIGQLRIPSPHHSHQKNVMKKADSSRHTASKQGKQGWRTQSEQLDVAIPNNRRCCGLWDVE